MLTIATVLTVLAALFGYLNARYLKLPLAIGLMVISIVFSLIILALGVINPEISAMEYGFVSQIDFGDFVLNGILSFILFAGALHVDFKALKSQSAPIMILATLGVLISTFVIGTAAWGILKVIGIPVPYIYTLLFGALISPTDPIAVLGILKQAGVPKQLEIKIVGESLFNDGIGVVVFATLLGIARIGQGNIEAGDIGLLFVKEVGGGIVLGLVLGFIAWRLMCSIDSYEVEVIITLALVMGGFWMAGKLHFSGPLTMVIAGLMIGHERFRTTAMSEVTETYVDKFWELIDMLLNAVLFVLIGLEIVIIDWEGRYLLFGLLAIPVILAARWAAVWIPVALLHKRLDFVPHTSLVLTWGGLRGGISIALALSLAEYMERDLILTATYVVVVFSIVIQGLTLEKLVRRLLKTPVA